MTIAETFEKARRFLQYEGTFEAEEAYVASRLLTDAATGIRHAHLMEPRQEIPPDREDTLQNWLEEAQKGRPIAYIVGKREFYGLSFQCDERALIPRPETELLVETALEGLRDIAQPQVADLGTGTGCIAISMAHSLPEAQVFATDASPGALELAAENARNLGVSERLLLVPGTEGDWAGPLAQWAGHFDAILTNPPYIAEDEIDGLQREIREWEPRTALAAGEDGLDCYRQIATQCRVLLKPTGFLVAELGAGQFEATAKLFEDTGWKVGEPLYDLAGIARVLQARPVVGRL